MTLYQNRFVEIILDEENSIIEMIWLPPAPLMSDDECKEIFLHYAELTEKHKPAAMLTYNVGEPYVIMPHMQEWLDVNVAPRTIQAGLHYTGIVVAGNNLFAQVATEQLIDEPNIKSLNTRFFNDVDTARQWLIRQTQLSLT